MGSFPYVLITNVEYEHQDITAYANDVVTAYITEIIVGYRVWFEDGTETVGKVSFAPDKVDYERLGSIRKAVEKLFK